MKKLSSSCSTRERRLPRQMVIEPLEALVSERSSKRMLRTWKSRNLWCLRAINVPMCRIRAENNSSEWYFHPLKWINGVVSANTLIPSDLGLAALKGGSSSTGNRIFWLVAEAHRRRTLKCMELFSSPHKARHWDHNKHKLRSTVIFHVIQHIINLSTMLSSHLNRFSYFPFLLSLLDEGSEENLFAQPWRKLIYI